MRRAAVAFALVSAFVLAGGACGGGGGSANDGGSRDSAGDTSVQRDAAIREDASQQDTAAQRDAPPANYDAGSSLVQCGTSMCNLSGGEECCITMHPACVEVNTCAGYATFNCDGPEDCFIQGRPICCAQDMVGGGGTNCAAESECSSFGNLRVCRKDTDCKSGEKCCGYAQVHTITVQYCQASASCTDTTPGAGIACGSAGTCTGTDVCCQGMNAGSCGTAAACTEGLVVQCDGPEDCQGNTPVCCGNIAVDGTVVSGGAACAASCTPTGVLGGVVCHSDADCTGGKVCRQKGYAGYSLRLCL